MTFQDSFASRALRFLQGRLGMKIYSPEQKDLLVFTHVPKTGGTSLTAVLRTVYGPRLLNVGRGRKEVEAKGVPNPESILAVSGHFPCGWVESLTESNGDPVFQDRTLRSVAIVREPVSRVISYFRYATSHPKHRLYERVKGMSAESFFEFLDREKIKECWNQQHRMIGGHLDDYFLAAPLEEIEGLNRTLAASFGWRREIPIPHANQQKREDAAPVSEKIREGIRQRSSLDLELYEDVRMRFQAGLFPAQAELRD